MKKIFLYLTVVLALNILASFTKQGNAPKLIGKWNASLGHSKVTFTFDKEGYFSITDTKPNGEVKQTGGKNNNHNGQITNTTFETNTGVTPNEIDVISTNVHTGKSERRFGIYTFKSLEIMKLRLNLNAGDKRPLNFERDSVANPSESSMITFEKEK